MTKYTHPIQQYVRVVCTAEAPFVGCGMVILISPPVGPFKGAETRQVYSFS